MVVILILPTNAYHLIDKSNIDKGRGSFPFRVSNYLYLEEVDALKWLSGNAEPNSVIVSSYNIGNYIPSYILCWTT